MSKTYFIVFLELFISCSILSIASAELFTSIEELRPLVNTEDFIIDSLREFLIQKGREPLRKLLQKFQLGHGNASNNIDAFIENHFQAFLLIKRLTVDLTKIYDNIDASEKDYFASGFKSKNLTLPSKEDLNGAALGMIRLQETYNFDLKNFADGDLREFQTGVKFLACDCFEIGKQAFIAKEYFNSLIWMHEAERRLLEELRLDPKSDQEITAAQIWTYYASTIYRLGNKELALQFTDKLLDFKPYHPNYFRNDEKAIVAQKITNDSIEIFIEEQERISWHSDIWYDYAEICSSNPKPPIKVMSKLSCYFSFKNSDFSKIAPFKVEEIYHDPEILMFHEVISNAEIKIIKDHAKPQLLRGLVYSSENNTYITSNLRISKSSFLTSKEHEVIADITKRVEDMTSLKIGTMQDFHVANYGVGGHYEPHYDIIPDATLNQVTATMLFYMSDVLHGGATIFPYLDLSVQPLKGSAIFWFNQFPCGRGIPQSLHASCAVSHGSKWVGTKWIFQHGQEFTRPCGLAATPEDPIT